MELQSEISLSSTNYLATQKIKSKNNGSQKYLSIQLILYFDFSDLWGKISLCAFPFNIYPPAKFIFSMNWANSDFFLKYPSNFPSILYLCYFSRRLICTQSHLILNQLHQLSTKHTHTKLLNKSSTAYIFFIHVCITPSHFLRGIPPSGSEADSEFPGDKCRLLKAIHNLLSLSMHCGRSLSAQL